MVSGNYIKIFLFFTKDDEIVILNKNSEFVNKLDRKIYTKLDTEVQTENEQKAVNKLRNNNINEDMKTFILFIKDNKVLVLEKSSNDEKKQIKKFMRNYLLKLKLKMNRMRLKNSRKNIKIKSQLR